MMGHRSSVDLVEDQMSVSNIASFESMSNRCPSSTPAEWLSRRTKLPIASIASPRAPSRIAARSVHSEDYLARTTGTQNSFWLGPSDLEVYLENNPSNMTSLDREPNSVLPPLTSSSMTLLTWPSPRVFSGADFIISRVALLSSASRSLILR